MEVHPQSCSFRSNVSSVKQYSHALLESVDVDAMHGGTFHSGLTGRQARSARHHASQHHGITRITLEPGWKWSVDVRPEMNTPLCAHQHLLYVLSGSFFVQMKDEEEVVQCHEGQICVIPANHDSWTSEHERCVLLELSSLYEVGKTTFHHRRANMHDHPCPIILKSFAHPDEIRTPNSKTQIQVIKFPEANIEIQKAICQPGWKWSSDIKPIVNTEWCQHKHLGYALRGSMEILQSNQERCLISANEVFSIPPNHDGWVIGNEVFECIEFIAKGYAKPAGSEKIEQQSK